jgi:hypothetical protein
MSSRLLDSGWVVQREILEMIPYRRGNDIDNFEYTIRLNLGGFRVTWAPQITIYSNEKSDFIGYLTLCLASIMNRVQMFINYSHLLVTRALLKANFNALEQIASTLKPPHFVFGFILAYLTYLAHMGHSSIPGNETTWFTLTLAYVGLQLFSLFVARARGSDYLTFFVWTPTVYVMSVLALPWALITSMISFGIQTRNSYEEKARSRQVMGNRFIETLEEEENNGPERYERIIQEVIEKRAPEKQVLKEKNYATQPSKPQLKETAPGQEAASHSSSHLEETKLVPLSNGEKQVQCQLKTITQCHPNGSQTYQMILQYKSVAFSTAPYHLQDQAFYELQSKLMNRGFTIVACGSCGNFYNASPQSSEQPSGVCLYGKLGKQIHPEEDGVTVLTEACPHYCGIEERESIVRQWRQSIITLLK